MLSSLLLFYVQNLRKKGNKKEPKGTKGKGEKMKKREMKKKKKIDG